MTPPRAHAGPPTAPIPRFFAIPVGPFDVSSPFCTTDSLLRMAIQTLDTARLASETGNLYETVVVISKRARQISSKTKGELDQRLSYFEDLSLDPAEELRSNEDQLRISLEYERKPKPTRAAVDEIVSGELYFRNPAASEENGL